jgi:hypothetical protein
MKKKINIIRFVHYFIVYLTKNIICYRTFLPQKSGRKSSLFETKFNVFFPVNGLVAHETINPNEQIPNSIKFFFMIVVLIQKIQ